MSASEKSSVLVSIAPYKYFVERIAGDTVDVTVLVPPGASSHSFEPSPKQVDAIAKADIWFRIGEGFEKQLIQVLQGHRPNMQIINLRQGVNMITLDKQHRCCSEDFEDVHIWLSPREAQIQAQTIANVLSATYPQHRELFQQNAKTFIRDLQEVDADLTKKLSKIKGKPVMVSHAAYGYMARDYGFNQQAVEYEGRDPTGKQLTNLIQQARAEGVAVIFVQPQHSSKGARLIAQYLNARIVELDPYSADYIENLRHIGDAFSQSQVTPQESQQP
ncbi:MAG: zinc ABC transporter substrate-binding protein [Chlamydiales bacterium]|nr:zinc ABC transporter substrate-binding protein [Chlamydiales bacterium]